MTGLGMLTRFVLRRDRVRMLVWVGAWWRIFRRDLRVAT